MDKTYQRESSTWTTINNDYCPYHDITKQCNSFKGGNGFRRTLLFTTVRAELHWGEWTIKVLVFNAYDLTSSLAVVARGTYLTWDRLPTNFRGTNLSGGTWENVRLLKKGWQYHECKGELDHSIHGPIRGDFWPQSPLRRSCTRNGSGGRCTYAKETRPDSAECKSKHRFYSDNWGHSPTISKILIYIHERRALGKSVITATFTLMTLLEWILAAAINKAAESHAKNRKIGLCKQQ